MNLAGQIAMTAARLMQHRAGTNAGRALRIAQRSAERAADRMEAATPRIATLTEAGLRFTEITCRCVDQLVRQGLEGAQGALADGAERLRMTAKAHSLGALYSAQLAALPATRRRLARDLETTWGIVTTAGRDLVELARSTRGELLQETPPRKRAASSHKPRGRSRTARGKRTSRRGAGEQRSST